MSQHKVVVTVAVTGSFGDRSTPNLPITPQEIAESALQAYMVGGAVAHIHVRDIESGQPSMGFHLYKEVVDRIRDRSDMIINLTTGAGARFIPGQDDPMNIGSGSTLCQPQRRLEHVLTLKPEICSLDIGSVNFGSHVFVNVVPHVEWMAEQIKDAGVKPELEVFDLGHIRIAQHLLDRNKVYHPPLFQLCMGIPWGIPASPQHMMYMVQDLPPDALWAGFGIGSSAYPMLVQAALLGGNVRIGMEDNHFLVKGKRAPDNRSLVEKAVFMLSELDKVPATSAEAREMLHL